MTIDPRARALLVPILALVASCGGNAKLDPGGEGGSTGTGSATCNQLEQAYAAVLADARSCDVAVDEPQCTELVYSELPCPCQEVFVNATKDDEIAALSALRDEYADRGCNTGACPAIACLSPIAGTCEGTGSTGLCQSE